MNEFIDRFQQDVNYSSSSRIATEKKTLWEKSTKMKLIYLLEQSKLIKKLETFHLVLYKDEDCKKRYTSASLL